jgi:hypothetical protein
LTKNMVEDSSIAEFFKIIFSPKILFGIWVIGFTIILILIQTWKDLVSTAKFCLYSQSLALSIFEALFIIDDIAQAAKFSIIKGGMLYGR